jgi:hypothetical protein
MQVSNFKKYLYVSILHGQFENLMRFLIDSSDTSEIRDFLMRNNGPRNKMSKQHQTELRVVIFSTFVLNALRK